MNIIKNRQGNTLIIVISIMTVFISIIFSFSQLFLTNLKNSKNLNNKYISKYASESGVEKSFYLVNKTGLNFDTIVNNNSYNTLTLNNGAVCKLELGAGSSSIISTLKNLDTYTITLNKKADYGKVKSVQIDWESKNPFEILSVSFDRYTNGQYAGNIFFNLYTNLNKPGNINLQFPGNPDNSIYKLTLTPLLYDLSNVDINFYDKNNAKGNQILLYSISGLRSTGTYLNSKQILEINNDSLNYFK